MKPCLLLITVLLIQQLKAQDNPFVHLPNINTDSLFCRMHGDTTSSGHKMIVVGKGYIEEGDLVSWRRSGWWLEYTADGVKIRQSRYEDHKVKEIKVFGKDGRPTVAMPLPEIRAAYPGGDGEWSKSVSKAIVAKTQDLLWDNAEGSVTVGFVVEKDGTVDHISILESLDRLTDKLVLKIAGNSPLWFPGAQDGQPAADYVVRVIIFHFKVHHYN
jgi:hypothetical protein